jgi:hypothetical protein
MLSVVTTLESSSSDMSQIFLFSPSILCEGVNSTKNPKLPSQNSVLLRVVTLNVDLHLNDGCTPFHVVAGQGQLSVITLILATCCNVDLKKEQTSCCRFARALRRSKKRWGTMRVTETMERYETQNVFCKCIKKEKTKGKKCHVKTITQMNTCLLLIEKERAK